jgi:uncharacterized protein
MSSGSIAGGLDMGWFLYRLLPPRPDFAATMTEHEKAAMGRHAGYWSELLAAGRAMIFSRVADPAGDWGVAIVPAATREDVMALGDADPAVVAEVARYDVLALPGAATAAPYRPHERRVA